MRTRRRRAMRRRRSARGGRARPRGARADFNLREAFIIGNRDFWASCSPSIDDPYAAAGAAWDVDHLRTGTLVLKGAEGLARDPVIDAFRIARAGREAPFDATQDP